MDKQKLESILTTLGEQVPPGSQLNILGGGALTLLGNPRPSFDLDFVGDDVHPSELHRAIMEKAKEMGVQVDIVPIDRFIPLPDGYQERNIHVGQFANLTIHIIDPYSIALSKVDRGLFTDYDDILFLIRSGYIVMEELERMLKNALPHAGKFDFHPDILAHLEELKSRLK
ncbi:MAG: hypothetical protein OHK0041_25400 [Anaerolineales bacterium]